MEEQSSMAREIRGGQIKDGITVQIALMCQ